MVHAVRSPAHPLGRLALIAAAVSLLAACTPAAPAHTAHAQLQKRVEVERVGIRLDLWSADGGELDAASRARLDRVLSEHEPGALHVALEPRTEAGTRAMTAAAARLIRGGVPPENVARLAGSRHGSGPDLELRASRYVVRRPDCPDWSRPAGLNAANRRPSNFGCATAHNLSTILADPRELRRGRTLSPADGDEAVRAIRRRARDGSGDGGNGGRGGSGSSGGDGSGLVEALMGQQ